MLLWYLTFSAHLYHIKGNGDSEQWKTIALKYEEIVKKGIMSYCRAGRSTFCTKTHSKTQLAIHSLSVRKGTDVVQLPV